VSPSLPEFRVTTQRLPALPREHPLHDTIAINQEMQQRGCDVNADDNE
jgi:hypothetical protein